MFFRIPADSGGSEAKCGAAAHALPSDGWRDRTFFLFGNPEIIEGEFVGFLFGNPEIVEGEFVDGTSVIAGFRGHEFSERLFRCFEEDRNSLSVCQTV